jgi:hypothetical protein
LAVRTGLRVAVRSTVTRMLFSLNALQIISLRQVHAVLRKSFRYVLIECMLTAPGDGKFISLLSELKSHAIPCHLKRLFPQ